VNAGRLTLFAIITAMEQDLRDIIRYQVMPAIGGNILSNETREEAVARWKRDGGDGEPTESHLLYFVDFGDLYQFLNQKRNLLNIELGGRIRAGTSSFETIAAVRNRIAHSRPLHHDDLPNTLDFVSELVRGHEGYWPHLSKTLAQLRDDPSFVLELDISSILRDDDISHNLPLPDFDETGFIGREEAREQIKRRILGPWPVISVLAEGGVGKTAVTLKAAYELIDEKSADLPFDAVVWVTSKTTQLGPTEIREIRGAITDSVGVMDAIASHLAGSAAQEDSMQEVQEYLREFRVLLFLDNLETVLDDRLRDFVSNLPVGSKIVTTSRTGIGAFEHPIYLDSLGETDSITLLRAAARVEGVDDLTRMHNRDLSRYVKRMHLNPAFIKWFVSAVRVGQPPEEVLASHSDMLLDFCLSNVYDFLSEESRRLLYVFQSAPGRHSQGELAYLEDEHDVHRLKKCLLELVSANMVKLHSIAAGSTYHSSYDLTDLSRDYLRRHHPVDRDTVRRVTARRNELRELRESLATTQPYNFQEIAVLSHEAIPVARLLRDALKSIGRRDYVSAEDAIETARQLHGDFFEVHRVSAYLAAERGDLTLARDAYRSALELAPDFAPLNVWFGGYLSRYEGDTAAAIPFFERALKLAPEDFTPRLELARAYLHCQRFADCLRMLGDVRADRLEGLDARKFYDLRIQARSRAAEHYSSRGSYDDTCVQLHALLEEFDRVPIEHRDVRIRERLQHGAFIAGRTRASSIVPPDAARELEALAKTLNGRSEVGKEVPVGERVEGSVARIVANRGFGFIMLDGGQEAFFHRSGLANPYYWPELESGARVSLVLVDTSRGLAAQDVELLD
jgi:LuxR family transcriptional regulator, glucitol operon activator